MPYGLLFFAARIQGRKRRSVFCDALLVSLDDQTHIVGVKDSRRHGCANSRNSSNSEAWRVVPSA